MYVEPLERKGGECCASGAKANWTSILPVEHTFMPRREIIHMQMAALEQQVGCLLYRTLGLF